MRPLSARRTLTALLFGLVLVGVGDLPCKLRPKSRKRTGQELRRRGIPRVSVGSTIGAFSLWNRWADEHPLPAGSSESGGADLARLAWREIGPRNVAGRVTSVAFRDSHDSRRVLAASAGGGIYASEDFGVTWRQLGGDRLPSLWIGAVAVDPGDPERIYAGTGDGNTATGGVGGARAILKSEDGGATFRTIPVSNPGAFFKIVVSRSAPSLVIAAATDGIHRSADFGETWEKTGSVPALDLVEDPSNSSRFLAVTGTIFGSFGGLVESLDGGRSWHGLGAGLPPSSSWGRSAVTIVDKPARTIFLSVGHPVPFGPPGRLYRSLDDGISWEAVGQGGLEAYHGNSWYGSHLKAIGTDAGQRMVQADGYVLLTGESEAGPISGSSNWQYTSGNWHEDTHGVEVSSSDPNRWIAATDGGVVVSTDGGRFFFRADQNFPTVQYYRCALAPGDPTTIFGGTQDVGLNVYRGDPSGSFDLTEWSTGAGDVTAFAVDPSNGNDVMALAVPAIPLRSRDGGHHWTELRTDELAKDLVVWALARSPTDPERVYAGGKRLHTSLDGGNTWTSTEVRPAGPQGNSWMRALELSPADERVLWAIYEDGAVFRSEDAGAAWSDRSPPGFHDGRRVSAGLDSESAYAAMGGRTRRLFRTHDGGKSWTDISGGLPSVVVNAVIADRRVPGRLFAGLETGVAISNDDGDHWHPFNSGLPNAMVMDLCADPVLGRLVAATYGRGMWEVSPIGVGRTVAPVPPVAVGSRR